MRHDIHGKDGLTPSRSSASTLTQSTTASSSLGSLGPRPSGHGTGTGGLQMEQEQEVRFELRTVIALLKSCEQQIKTSL